MAVYRLPPVAQWQQAEIVADVRSVDAPGPQPLPELYHLRRRHDHEAVQQPRRLLNVSVTASVDAPLPLPEPPIVWLRRRHDYEVAEQPRRLLDVATVQSVDSPTGFIAQAYARGIPRTAQQARGLPVDILAPAVVADNPTGAPYQFYTAVHRGRQQWLQARPLDVSTTQSVDSPPGYGRQQATPPSAARGAQWQQAIPGAIDIPVTFVPFTPQAYARRLDLARQPWLQLRPLDVSVTQSVDSPPGFTRPALPATRPATGAQWLQAGHGLISAPDDVPALRFNAAAYIRQVAATQAWQKTQPVLHLVTVEAPPLSGPYPTAPYRRPRYTPPVPMPAFAAFATPPFVPSMLASSAVYYRPAPATYARPRPARYYRPDISATGRAAPDRNDRPGA